MPAVKKSYPIGWAAAIRPCLRLSNIPSFKRTKGWASSRTLMHTKWNPALIIHWNLNLSTVFKRIVSLWYIVSKRLPRWPQYALWDRVVDSTSTRSPRRREIYTADIILPFRRTTELNAQVCNKNSPNFKLLIIIEKYCVTRVVLGLRNICTV